VAECFANKPMIAQHRLVYDLVRDLIPHPIHALALSTRAPSKGNT
jgi:BolA protein